ncbi:hypothetical protein ACWC9H_27365 [Streptomyces sp. NPDC001251]
MTLPESLTHAPQWAPTAGAAALAIVLLLAFYARQRGNRLALGAPRRSHDDRGAKGLAAAGPLALLGACGMLLSIYGLFGFATRNMDLAWPWAIPIVAIFDLAEVTCFVSLYRSASVETRWTHPMRRTRRMAWMLVAASSAMNAAHAPGNWVATCAFAAVPPISVKLIEFELDKLLAANTDDDQDDERPGFARLVQLGYAHAWAALFARMGLDAASRNAGIAQDARIRRAAQKIQALGHALDEAEQLAANGDGTSRSEKKAARKAEERAKQRVDQAQHRAQLAIDLAKVAGDTPAQLLLARHLATRGRVADLARMDVRKPLEIVTTLEELAIVPSAAAIREGARAAQAQQERKDAEAARDAARAEQEAAEQAARTVRQKADEALAAAHQVLSEAEKKAEMIASAAVEAERTAAEAKGRQTDAENAVNRLAGQIRELTTRAQELKTTAEATDGDRRAAADRLASLVRQAENAEKLVTQRRQEAEGAQRAALRAQADKNAALEAAQTASTTARSLEERAEQLRIEVEQYAGERQQRADELDKLDNARLAAQQQAQAYAVEAEAAREAARQAREEQNAAEVALRHSRDEIMDALTSPTAYEPPRWTSEPKRRGWDLYLHRVRNDGTEPTDEELAAGERDPSTARKWLADYRAELARMTAAALPAQQGAHSRTADEAPALV